MKQTLTTLLIIFTIGFMSAGLVSCRKTEDNVGIKDYDQQQIQAYITANGLTSMKRDLSGGDTTGIYYQILRPGKGPALDYSDYVAFTYTIKSLDGNFSTTDTILNHQYALVGHLNPPKGLMLAIKNILINNGTQARVLIPSRLAYGAAGSGTGSGRLPGNTSLDYYINIIDNQPVYDDLVIQNYIKANGLTGFTKTPSGLYYKVAQVGTGTTHVTDNSTIGIQFTGKLLNGTIFDSFNAADTTATPRDYALIPKGWQEGFKLVTKGAKLSLIVPSGLAYGATSGNYYGFGTSTPSPNSCLYYDFNIESITN